MATLEVSAPPAPAWRRLVAKISLLPPATPRPAVRMTVPVAGMLVGYSALAVVLAVLGVRGTSDPWPLVLSVLIIALLAGYSVDTIGGAGTSVNTNDFMYLGIAFTYGPLGCLCAAAADIAARKLMGPFDWFRTAFNFVNFFVSSVAAWFVFSQLETSTAISWHTAISGALAGLTLFVTQHIFVLYLFHFTRRAPLLPAMKSMVMELLPFYVGYGWAAVSYLAIYRALGLLGISLIVTPVLLLQGFLVYLARRVHVHGLEIEAEHQQRVNLLQELVVKQRGFVANAAHELRTPLTTMAGSLEIMQQYPDMDEAQRLRVVDDALLESRRLSNLVDGLLELAALDSAEQIRFKEFDWDELVAAAVADMGKQMAPRQISFDVDAGLGRGVGDARRLRRLFEIVAANVAAHTPKDASVHVSVMRVEDGQILISVEDNGPGVPSALIDRTFERFFQVDPSRHGAAPGLGLAIARTIATAHHGSIGAQEVKPHGLRVVARIPPFQND